VDNISNPLRLDQADVDMTGYGSPCCPTFILMVRWPRNYGVLRFRGVTERALFVIDTKGIIRYIDVHDINERPPLDDLVKALQEVNKP